MDRLQDSVCEQTEPDQDELKIITFYVFISSSHRDLKLAVPTTQSRGNVAIGLKLKHFLELWSKVKKEMAEFFPYA